MEQNLKKIYRKSAKDITKKWTQYMEREDKRLSALRESGSIREYQEALGAYTLRNQHYKDMLDEVTLQLAHVNEIALAYTKDQLPEIYTINYNQAKETADEVGVSFTLVNESVIKRMVRDGDIELPNQDKRVNIPKDQRWNTKQLNSSVLQGILQGESMDKIADRIYPIVGRNESAAIRNARTMVTGAENRGRLDSYKQLEEDGLVLKKVWMATPDGRTRDWHIDMDGQEVNLDENFIDGLGNELEYPGDPGGAPETVWNCRCTMITDVVGFRREDGSISTIDYEPEGETLHERQLEKEMANRGIEKSQNNHKKMFMFEPAETKEAAKQYIEQYVDAGKFGALGVDYTGVDLEVQNIINKTLSELQETYNIPKFGGIKAPAGNTKEGKRISSATAAYSPIRDSFYLNRNALKTKNIADKNLKKEREAITDIYKNPDKYDLTRLSASVRKVIENGRESGRATVPQTVEEVIWHEYGHRMEKFMSKEDFEKAVERMGDYAPKISGYACSDKSEYIAESFCCYNNGEADKVDPVLKEVFERMKK